MIKYLYCFLLLGFSLPLTAQSPAIDSLQKVIQSGDPKARVKALNALANMVVYDKPEEAKKYAHDAIRIAKSIGDKPDLGDAYTRIGIAFDVSGIYDSSIYYYELALSIYNELKNLRGRGSALNNLGLIYWNMADYDRALTYFFDALRDFESVRIDAYRANALNNIGMVYDDTKNFKQALIYHHKAREVYEKMNDNYLKGAVYNNLANSYSNLNLRDSALHFYQRAINMHLLAKDDYGLSIAYGGYAGLLQEEGKLDEALEYNRKAFDLKTSLNEVSGQASTLVNISDIYLAKKDPVRQLETLDKAKTIAEKNNLRKELIHIYQRLAAHFEQKDIKTAYDYYKKLSTVKDSVFNETSNRQITELNTKYETEKKELQLKKQDLIIARKNMLIWGISAAVILLGFTGFYFYKRYQFNQEKKLQAELMKQQELATRSIIAAEENERKRIAADLHDGIGQMMSAAKMNLSAFENEISFSSPTQQHKFEDVISMIDDCCREVRSVSHQMMPNALLKNGLASAVKEFIDRIDNRMLKVSLHADGLHQRIDSNTESVLYRVIQECVNNVIKHSQASTMDISLINDGDGIAITLEDNGVGFDSSRIKGKEGLGLKNIFTRVQYLKGTVDFDSSPGKGTLVAIHIPTAA